MKQEQREKWENNPNEYYKNVDQFAYPVSTAIERKYVYFDKLDHYYKSFKFSGSHIFSSKLLKQWRDIFSVAKQIQQNREREFISNAKLYLSNLTKEQQDLITQYNTSKAEGEAGKIAIQFFQSVLVNNELAQVLNDNIKWDEDLQKAFEQAVDENKESFTDIMSETAGEKATEELYKKVIDNLIKIVGKKDLTAAKRLKQVKGSAAIINMLKTLGYIRENSFAQSKKSIVNKFLEKNKGNADVNFNASNYKSSLIGIRDEMIRRLSFGVSNGKDVKVRYLGTTSKKGSSSFQKTDLSISIPSLDKKMPVVRVNLSLKAASFAKDSNFILPAKLVGKGSLSKRYDDIVDALTSFSSDSLSPANDLNALFFMINNEAIRSNGLVSSAYILDILSYIALTWMFDLEDFKEIKEGATGAQILNFFSIGGKIVPSSVVFSLMEQNLNSDKFDPNEIVGINITPPTKDLTYNYYVDAGYQDRAKKMKNSNTKKESWNWVRDWVEKEAQMAVMLKTNNIFKILQLNL